RSANPPERDSGWEARKDARTGYQAGLSVRLRSRDWEAGMADRRAARSQVGHARRGGVAYPTFSDEARALRVPGRPGERFCGLYAADPCIGGRDSKRITAGPAVYSTIAGGNDPEAEFGRRRKLGWRGGGSRDQNSVCALPQCMVPESIGAAGSFA